MAAVQPTSTQRRTGSSRTQTISASPAAIPLQTITPTSTSQSPSTQNITTQATPRPAPIPNQPASSRNWTIPVTSNVIACAALLVTLVFGIGVWVGQAYGNMYSKKSYYITLWGLCADHPGIQQSEVCRDRLRDGLHRSVKRGLDAAMYYNLDPFSVKAYTSPRNIVYFGIGLPAMTILDRKVQFIVYNIALTVDCYKYIVSRGIWDDFVLPWNPLCILWLIGVDCIFNKQKQRWKQRPLYAVFRAIAATASASIPLAFLDLRGTESFFWVSAPTAVFIITFHCVFMIGCILKNLIRFLRDGVIIWVRGWNADGIWLSVQFHHVATTPIDHGGMKFLRHMPQQRFGFLPVPIQRWLSANLSIKKSGWMMLCISEPQKKRGLGKAVCL